MHYIMHIKFIYLHKLNIYNIYSKLYTKTHSNLASRRKEAFGALALLRLLAGILLRLLMGLLLSSNIDIMSQCGVVCFRLLKFFLDISQFIFLPLNLKMNVYI
jgi:hypothetical protein